MTRKTRISRVREQEEQKEEDKEKGEKKRRIRTIPPHLKLLQIYKITRKRLSSRKRDKELYDDLITRLIDQYIAGRH